MKKSMLRNYARLAVNVGVNLQKGQDLIIYASVNQKDFVKYLVEEGYKAKARKVTVEWNYDELTKIKYKKESLTALKELPNWAIEKRAYFVEKLPARIYVEDSDPDALAGVDTAKMAAVRKHQYPLIKKYIDAEDNRYQWSIIAMPSVAWAKKVFPDMKPRDAFKALEEAIIKCTRLEGDAVKNWEEHTKYLKTKSGKMNEYNFEKLTYKSSNGTDFTIGLQENHVWLSAEETHLGGISFIANMPTEECFTMPAKYSANGTVVATKPLSYNGNLIKDFKITFENGKAVKVEAKENQALLEQMISMDEAACYLGEVALVPYNSPINESNVLFLNTLFDENACCHLALGMAFKNNIKGYENMSEEDFKKVNYNDSMIHVDFMVGAKDLSIVGTTHDGKEVQVFKDGVWAI